MSNDNIRGHIFENQNSHIYNKAKAQNYILLLNL